VKSARFKTMVRIMPSLQPVPVCLRNQLPPGVTSEQQGWWLVQNRQKRHYKLYSAWNWKYNYYTQMQQSIYLLSMILNGKRMPGVFRESQPSMKHWCTPSTCGKYLVPSMLMALTEPVHMPFSPVYFPPWIPLMMPANRLSMEATRLLLVLTVLARTNNPRQKAVEDPSSLKGIHKRAQQ